MSKLDELQKLSIFLETRAETYKTAKAYTKGKNAEKFEQFYQDYRRFDCILHDYIKILDKCFVKEKSDE